MREPFTFVQLLVMAMEGRGEMTNQAIYREMKVVCEKRGRKLPANWEAEVRQTLQANCPGSPRWSGIDDFFVNPGRGRWSCKVTSPPPQVLVLDP